MHRSIKERFATVESYTIIMKQDYKNYKFKLLDF